jgi:hypothetical protein
MPLVYLLWVKIWISCAQKLKIELKHICLCSRQNYYLLVVTLSGLLHWNYTVTRYISKHVVLPEIYTSVLYLVSKRYLRLKLYFFCIIKSHMLQLLQVSAAHIGNSTVSIIFLEWAPESILFLSFTMLTSALLVWVSKCIIIKKKKKEGTTIQNLGIACLLGTSLALSV